MMLKQKQAEVWSIYNKKGRKTHWDYCTPETKAHLAQYINHSNEITRTVYRVTFGLRIVDMGV